MLRFVHPLDSLVEPSSPCIAKGGPIAVRLSDFLAEPASSGCELFSNHDIHFEVIYFLS